MQRRYRLVDTVFAVCFGSPAAEERIHPALAHLEEPGAGAPHCELEIAPEGTGFVLRENGSTADACAGLAGLAPMMKAAFWRIAVNRQSYLMQIHAGAVFDGSACILLPGPPGSGKTTLTAALTAAGFGYLSDEAALVEPTPDGSLAVRPVPLALTVKRGSLDLLAGLYPGLRELAEHSRQDGRDVRYLSPPPAARLPDRPLPVRSLVFPHVGARTRLSPLSRIEALSRLLGECLALPEDLTPERVRMLVRWMRRLECYELSLGSLEEAVALVSSRPAPRAERAAILRQMGNAA